jgi:hypothetical protein
VSNREQRQDTSLVVGGDQPLIGIARIEDGRETVHYYCREEDAEAASSSEVAQEALALAGAWADLDWSELEQGLDRIRHQSRPTPPISV